MSSPSLTGLRSNNPLKYLGPNVAIETVVTRNREPTGADYRQPETGKYYPFGCLWLVGKDPTTGTYGDLWYLAYIESNVAVWSRFAASYSKSTWTPTIDGSTPGDTIYGIQYGSYVEFEALVQAEFTVTIVSATGTGNLKIGGLPFPINPATNGNVIGSVIMVTSLTWPANTTSLALLGSPGNSYLTIWCSGSATLGSEMQMANTPMNIQGTIVYEV